MVSASLLVNINQALDYIPGLSIASNLANLFIKYAWIPNATSKEDRQNNLYYNYLDKKTVKECLLFCIPLAKLVMVIGNYLFGTSAQPTLLQRDSMERPQGPLAPVVASPAPRPVPTPTPPANSLLPKPAPPPPSPIPTPIPPANSLPPKRKNVGLSPKTPIDITGSITSADQIPHLRSINGHSIEEIEELARPAQSPTGPNPTVATKGLAQSGFLGMHESLKEVLLQDWHTVTALGWTHQQLSFHLRAIAQAAETVTNEGKRIKQNWPPYPMSYKISTTKTPQKLTVDWLQTRGYQKCIFDTPRQGVKEFSWNRECTINNPSTGATVIWNPGVENYIRNYGFYEGGGTKNQYRVDPIALISILTGTPMESLRQQVEQASKQAS